MDAVDRAQAREIELRDDALAAAQNRKPEAAHVVDGQRLCLDCDDPISAKRLKANPQAVRCMDCQRRQEQQRPRAGPA